ncbi:restriction endonuclease fold toxin [Streptomyces sp. SGAir0957]
MRTSGVGSPYQAKATFERAIESGRTPYFHFDRTAWFGAMVVEDRARG